MAVALINGKSYAHQDIVFRIGDVPIVSLSDLTVDESQDKEFNYGTGNLAVSYGIGKKNPADVSFTLSLTDVDALEDASPNKDIKDIPPFDIPVTILSTKPYTMYLKNVLIQSTSKSTDTDTMDIKVAITAQASHVIKR